MWSWIKNAKRNSRKAEERTWGKADEVRRRAKTQISWGEKIIGRKETKGRIREKNQRSLIKKEKIIRRTM